MGSPLRRIVGLTLALVLSGTPAVAAACVALCGPVASAGHAGPHASAPVAHHTADPGAVPAAEHHHHHDASADVPDAGVGHVANPGSAAVLASASDCCADLAGVTITPARVETRADVAPPLVAPSTLGADTGVFRASLAHDPPVGPPPPPAPVRAPLILRI